MLPKQRRDRVCPPPGLLIALALVAATGALGCRGTGEAEVHGEFPIKSGRELSPPMVHRPIHDCARAVHVYGFVPHAHVKVYANGTELIGEVLDPDFGFADIDLTRALANGEKVSATQTVSGFTSAHTINPVTVTTFTGTLGKPDVGDDLYECGRIVPVGDLVESARVHVLAEGSQVGQAEAPGSWKAVWTQPLNAGERVTAYQALCEDDPARARRSPESDPVVVQSAPNPMPSPTVHGATLITGNDKVDLTGLLVGARVRVYDNGVEVGGGWANGSGNWVPIDPPLSTTNVTATQELCGVVSPPSEPVKPKAELGPPIVLAPLCEGQQHVVLRGSIVNATVVIFRNGAIAGYGGAGPGDLVLGLGGGAALSAGDVVTARQYMGSTLSPLSNAVTVTTRPRVPSVEILGGNPFFLPESGEQAIDGPVFPRGEKKPRVNVQTCCADGIRVWVRQPGGGKIAELAMTEVFPGYFTGVWDWQSSSGWSIPGGIPVGKYEVEVAAGCDLEAARVLFYVIFDPDDVGGPPRFSFNETGVWFGAPSNGLRALHYYLHPDDKRVFDLAIGAAQGMTDPLQAAQKIGDTEEAQFQYSLSWHGQDVLNMLTSETHAQCADDANVLTAFLRAVGIPAHPATADAGLESGAANWTFDTWTEFLVPTGGGKTDWLILHPHEYETMSPETRLVFGTTRPVAVKSFNDVIVFADETWDWSEAGDLSKDVSYSRNSCQEPVQHITVKSWVEEVCETGYWTEAHWACGGSGIGSSSSGLTATWLLDLGDFAFGRTLSGRLRLVNESEEAAEGELAVDLAFDFAESKVFPDERLATRTFPLRLAPGERFEEAFEFEVPRTLPLGAELALRAGLGERTLGARWLEPEHSVVVSVDAPRTALRVGDTVRLPVTISNRTKRIVDGVSWSVEVPFAFELEGEAVRAIGRLQPEESRRVEVVARVVAPIDAGSIVVGVDSGDGGWARERAVVRVLDPTPPDIRRAVGSDD